MPRSRPTTATADPPEPALASRLRSQIVNWYEANARDLPWRTPERTAWGVMVSEFMLQQTPVARVLPMWIEWMQRWPTPADLAREPSGAAVGAWGRLGYPRRALRLHAAARAITDEHDGAVPDTLDELLALPGVGAYTAGAILAFAHTKHAVVMDTNIRRVEARLFGGRALPGPSPTAAEWKLAEQLTPDGDAESAAWTIAVMELGALICTARSPSCLQCPVVDDCAWVAAGSPPPTVAPKGQAWAGTNRQLRGAIIAVVRESDDGVALATLVAPVGTGAVDLAQPDDAQPTQFQRRLSTLHALGHPAERTAQAVTDLVSDGLLEFDGDSVRLPT